MRLDLEKLAEMEEGKIALLMQAAEQSDDDEARKVYLGALSKFQGAVGTITKDKNAGRYDYAGIDDIMRVIRKPLAENGLSIQFDTTAAEGALTAICRVGHAGGYVETSSLTVPVDSKLSANDSQKMGSANSYARRYCLINALNLTVGDEDDDGLAGGTATITQDQADDIRRALDEQGRDHEKFLSWGQIERIEDLPAGRLSAALALLTPQKKAAKKKTPAKKEAQK